SQFSLSRLLLHFFSLLIRLRPPSPTPFPYTTLFRSDAQGATRQRGGREQMLVRPQRKPVRNQASTGGCRTGGHVRFEPPHTLNRSEEHTSELQSHLNLVCRLLLEKKKTLHPNAQPNK